MYTCYMKFLKSTIFTAVALFAMAACAEDKAYDYAEFEDASLGAWIRKYRPEIAENYQEEGGYYVEIEELGDMDAAPVNDTLCWVEFDFSGRDMAGNIVLTRRAEEARLAGSYTRYTRYVPYYRYCGNVNTSMLEGTHLAMRNALTLGEKYAADRGLPREVKLREGSKVTLYMPSRIVGGLSGDGGYEGQDGYTLSASKPLIVEMVIRDTVKNPLEREGRDLNAFCRSAANGGLRIYSNDKEDASAEPMPAEPSAANHPYNVPERWTSVNDSTALVYVNYRFDPATDRISFPEPYASPYEPYNAFDAMEQKIAEALVKRFHTDDDGVVTPYAGVKSIDADSVDLEKTVSVWYIGRTLDGFIFDTNIDEVKEIVYGEVASEGSAFDPSTSTPISSWQHALPTLKYGQWAAVVSTSTFAYGVSGVSGSTSTSTTGGYSSSYYDYLNYYNYYNNYYGNSYYGGYYNSYYGGYNDYYYNNYYYNNYYGTDTETTTTTTISTEIPPYTPLLFEIYIEPKR